MTWPPRVGDPLLRAEDAYNIREKLASYAWSQRSSMSSLPGMAVIRQRINENDPVALRDQIGKWPAGTLGAAVDIYHGAALVEIVDDHGRTLNLLTAPDELLEVQRPRA